MFKKFAILLPGAVALFLAGAPMLTVHAQSMPGTTPKMEMKRQKMDRLGLSDAQKAQLKQIREATQVKIRGVLRPDQVAKLDAARQERMNRRAQAQAGQRPAPGQRMERGGIMRSLDLDTNQKAAIKKIMQDARAEMRGVFTPEQLKKMEEMRRAHGHRTPKSV